ncbi:ImmA/IrrE family metallo-endopeptidase [Solimonas sp. SE-A11]|uniref:ImmA/IrrE family metallo-endopeptidase n=1 Tax=Solimonas sp. SE-A11 TaxID=3054954 RepID=UPI00259D04D3|nr:ImmA/IrrE family metallo-endopeptidase [Solimonas sp. SE-A11]MDM4772864.1 ImmA/IrrE family metallo-endopeptidase [Solimonas sp. SE-A11]
MHTFPKKPEALLIELGLLSVPVNVDAVAAALNLSVSQQILDDDVSGFLVVKGGRGSVVINKSQHLNRRRFTMAHEIGHYVLHASSDRLFLDRKFPTISKVDESVYLRSSSQSTSAVEEIEANNFAAEMLMPKTLVENFVKRARLSFHDEEEVSACARAFGVSEQAMLIRLKRLGLLKIA